jgi:alpha-glucosidase
MCALLIALLLLPFNARVQDERRIVSPNGQVEFFLFVGQPEGALWPRVGYQVSFRGKPVLTTSWMGIDIRDQEPLLGENPAFMSSDASGNSLVAHYMQNGSLGRRLDVEIRAFDDGVAFRYVIPRSTQIADILIRDEATEFNFVQPGTLSHLDAKPDYDVPFVIEEPGVGWVEITDAGPESRSTQYPRTYLLRSSEGTGVITNLSRKADDPTVAYAGTTPLLWPWRVILVAADREHLERSETLRKLSH